MVLKKQKTHKNPPFLNFYRLVTFISIKVILFHILFSAGEE